MDISIQYHTFEFDKAIKNLYVIHTPFGNYWYNHLATGVKQSPGILQEIVESLFCNLPETNVCIDDVGVFSNSCKDHLQCLTKVLSVLQQATFMVNPLKCEWQVKETDWLQYWLTPTGLKPWSKNVYAILALHPPTTVSAIYSFIGAVTSYCDMFPKQSYILAPFTAWVS